MSDIIREKRRGKHIRRRGHKKASLSKRFAARHPKIYTHLVSLGSFLKRHRLTTILLSFFFLGLIISLLSTCIPSFALGYSNSVGQILRVFPATLLALFPFSVAEIFFILFLLFIPIWLVTLVLALRKKYTLHRIHRKMRRILLAPVVAVLLVVTSFLFTFYPSYHCPPLSNQLGVSETVITEQNLYDTLNYLTASINTNLRQIESRANGSTIMSTPFNETAMDINVAYQTVSTYKNICPANGAAAKPLVSSKILTKLDIAGIFTFFTGESNINTDLPDFLIPHTIAHESAHQRGIASESDANFLAFVACRNSTDPYVLYSGYLNTLLTIRAEFYDFLNSCEDVEFKNRLEENFQQIWNTLDPRVQSELDAYKAFCLENDSPLLSTVSEELNDTYLKAQGMEDGTQSYQKLTGLVVNFYTTYLA